MLKELRLCGKKIDIENSPVLMSYQPDENWEKLFRRLRGKWSVENGWPTLSSKLSTVDADIATLKAKNNGHTDAEINTLIDNKINALDVADSGTGYVTAVSQTDGKISVTKSSLPTADANTAGITKLGATGGAATYDAVFGTDGNGGINAQVNANAGEIAKLKESVAGGVHFRGTVTTEPTAGTTTVNGTAVAAGDIVIYDGKEYIYTGSAWEQLGDVTRVGNLETKLNNLDVTDTVVTSQFVTAVSQTDGKITVSRAQATASDIKHGDTTVSATLESQASEIAKKANASDVYTKTETGTQITNAINGLTHNTPTGTGDFVVGVTQTNGKITVEKGSLPTASSTVAGIVKLNAEGGAAPYSVMADVASLNSNAIRAVAVSGSTDEYKLQIGSDATDVIIFDCGGAL